MEKGRALCLLGPTGAGKTEAALALADAFNGAVVNFDSRQVYREIPVTTAQPSPEERARCPHLLYGFLQCSETISAGTYAEMAAKTVTEVMNQGMTPILVGGTGLYLRALLDGMAPIPDVPAEIREKVFADWDELGPIAMHERLAETDPVYAAKIHPNDRQRVTRALEVIEATGKTFSQWHAATAKVLDVPCLRLGIAMEKAELHGRLARRIEAMLEAGAIEEVRQALKACPEPDAPGLSGIGCAELAAHLRGALSLEDAKTLWLANTKAYAKRQMTWFRKDRDVHWVGPKQTARMVELAGEWLRGGD
ncbi:MAG: tRNA (adenosine(37)-N6)-dimethylallyltransferase MiaA [Thermodesulfobacteriota bacterium]